MPKRSISTSSARSSRPRRGMKVAAEISNRSPSGISLSSTQTTRRCHLMFPLVVALLLCPTCNQMHAQRAIHSATRLADGRVLIAGGMIHNRAVLATAEVFDPATGQFSGTGDMPEPRMSHSATLLADGHVLL